MTENYKVVASTQTCNPYPVYKYFEDPEKWVGNGTVVDTCKDGAVDVKIMEMDTNKIHHLRVYSDDGPAKSIITEQFDHPT